MKISQKITRSLVGMGLFMVCFAMLQSCKKTSVTRSDSRKPVTRGPRQSFKANTSGVYVVGSTSVRGIKVAAVWKDGVATVLGRPGVASTASGIFISGNDVYICGSENGIVQYWKNGMVLGSIETERTADAIAVTGDDVWVLAGGLLWKNGIVEHLNIPFPVFTVQAIAVSGGDFYVCVNTGLRIGVLRNGKFSFVSAQSSPMVSTSQVPEVYGQAVATSMFASGKDFYIGGFQDVNGLGRVMYWLNGTEFRLDRTGLDFIRSIAVQADDVYSVTADNFYLNALKQTLPADLDKIQYVGVSGPDLYLFGTKASRSLYLKNGRKVELSGEEVSISAFAIL